MRFKLVIFFMFVCSVFCFVKAEGRYNVFKTPQIVSGSVSEDTQTLFILDYSNSMNEFLFNNTKYEMLLDSLKIILSKMSANNKVGVRIYGHRWGITPMDACRASSLITPIGVNNSDVISKILSKYSPRGMTPITYSLK